MYEIPFVNCQNVGNICGDSETEIRENKSQGTDGEHKTLRGMQQGKQCNNNLML